MHATPPSRVGTPAVVSAGSLSMRGAKLAAALSGALDHAGDADSFATLRRETLDFARRMRGENFPPEHVVLALKAIFARGNGCWLSLASDFGRDGTPSTLEYRAYARAFAWCLEGYFGGGPGASQRRRRPVRRS